MGAASNVPAQTAIAIVTNLANPVGLAGITA
jgi:hypothetical protein